MSVQGAVVGRTETATSSNPRTEDQSPALTAVVTVLAGSHTPASRTRAWSRTLRGQMSASAQNVAAAIGPSGGQPANTIPLRVRAEGLVCDVQVPGYVSAWARTSTGAWLARAQFSIPTGNGRGYLEVDQWCPAAAVRPCQ